MSYSRTYAEQLATVTGAPWWVAQSMAELEPVSEGTWYEEAAPGGHGPVTWHAERNRVSLTVTRTASWRIVPGQEP